MKFIELANFQEKQLEAWYTLMSPQCKYLLYGGAAGGGKSYLLRWAAVGLALYYYKKFGIKGVPIGLFSEDYPTLRDRQVTKINREFPEWLGVLKETQASGLAFFLHEEYGSGMILLRNLDDPSKYSSVEFAAVVVEELTKNPYQTFEDLRNRMRFPGIDERKFLGATNPGEIGHGWVKRLFVTPDPNEAEPDPEQEKFFFLKSLVTDNKYNPADYILQLQAIRDPQKRKALLEGDWNQFKGQYFEEWRDSLHVCNPFMPERLPNGNIKNVIVGGLDWGSENPFAFYLAEVGRVVYNEKVFYRAKVFLEAYGTKKSPEMWSKEIITKMRGFGLTMDDVAWVRADTQIWAPGNDAKALDIFSQFVQANEGWRKMRKANKDRLGGWQNLSNWLSIAPDGLPYLQFASNCMNAIRTIPELIHDENNVEDVNSKGEDHSGDSIRYMQMALKWIDGGVGGVAHTAPTRLIRTTAHFIGDKQLSMDTDAFGEVDKTTGNIGGVIRS